MVDLFTILYFSWLLIKMFGFIYLEHIDKNKLCMLETRFVYVWLFYWIQTVSFSIPYYSYLMVLLRNLCASFSNTSANRLFGWTKSFPFSWSPGPEQLTPALAPVWRVNFHCKDFKAAFLHSLPQWGFLMFPVCSFWSFRNGNSGSRHT